VIVLSSSYVWQDWSRCKYATGPVDLCFRMVVHQVRLSNTRYKTEHILHIYRWKYGHKRKFSLRELSFGSFGAMLPLCLIGAVQESALFPDLIRFVEIGIVLCGC